MPNHVTNRLRLTGSVDDVSSAKNLIMTSNLNIKTTVELPEVDFNRLIPMPAILGDVVSPVRKGPNGRTMLADQRNGFSMTEREATAEEQATLDNIPFGDWYSWSVENWGTKWNGYHTQVYTNEATYEFTFDTAWSAPTPIFDELAQRFPNVGMDISWYDEGGCHAGCGKLGLGVPADVRSESFYTDADDQLFEKAYGHAPSESSGYFATINEETLFWSNHASRDDLRMAENFTCFDVGEAMDANGNFPLVAEYYSTDDPFLDDDLCYIRGVRDRIKERLGI